MKVTIYFKYTDDGWHIGSNRPIEPLVNLIRDCYFWKNVYDASEENEPFLKIVAKGLDYNEVKDAYYLFARVTYMAFLDKMKDLKIVPFKIEIEREE